MMTRPVAVARSVIVTGVIWGVGALVVVGLFGLFDASATIDVRGDRDRAQVVWLGAHAFVACVAALVGVTLGASALTRAGVASSASAIALVGLVTFAAGVGVALAWATWGGVDQSMLAALVTGLGIGTAGATIFVSQSDQDPAHPYGGSTRRHTGRSWSSR
jgi:hypothetical protein